ncbi:MAG: PEP-CTERM sorting domain-containing protein [Planctomycetota bacterium]|nr:PEP-CTERM sorting domain-containing protein [Planctomycetota bacterium]
MKFYKLAALLAIFTLPTSAQAGALESIFQDEIVKLEDVDYEVALDGGDGTLDVGDHLLAIIEFEGTRLAASNNLVFSADPTTDAITAVSLVTVTGVTTEAGGSIANYVLTGADAATWSTHTGITAVDGTALIAYLDPPSDPGEHITNSTVAAGVASATEGDELFRFGVDASVGFSGTATDFAGGTNDATNANNLDSLNFFGGFDVISQTAMTSSITFVKHNFLGLTGSSDLQLQGALESQGGAGGFDFVTDSDVYFYAVPEPSSLLAFAGVFGLGLMRRRRS